MSNWLTEKCDAVRRSTIRRGAIETVSGYAPLALPLSTGERIRMMTVYGKSVQNGTPAPDAPVSVVGAGGKCRSRGKNLFDKNKITTGKKVASTSDGTIIISSIFNVSNYISISGGADYCLSGVVNYSSCAVGYYDVNKIYISGVTANNGLKATPTNAKYIVVTLNSDSVATLQLELSPTATTYAPFASPSIIAHPTLHGIPLASTATDYTYIDSNGVKYAADTWQWREEGVWEHVQRVGVKVLDGTENWVISAGNTFYINTPLLYMIPATPIMCTHYKYGGLFTSSSNVADKNCAVLNNASTARIDIKDSAYTTAPEFKAALTANHITVNHLLATPIVTQYTHVPWMHTIDASHAGNPLDIAYLDNVDGTTVMPWIQASYYKEVVI